MSMTACFAWWFEWLLPKRKELGGTMSTSNVQPALMKVEGSPERLKRVRVHKPQGEITYHDVLGFRPSSAWAEVLFEVEPGKVRRYYYAPDGHLVAEVDP